MTGGFASEKERENISCNGILAEADPMLPPLNALRAFEAVARHKSFTRAAGELNVSQSAVSHQVRPWHLPSPFSSPFLGSIDIV